MVKSNKTAYRNKILGVKSFTLHVLFALKKINAVPSCKDNFLKQLTVSRFSIFILALMWKNYLDSAFFLSSMYGSELMSCASDHCILVCSFRALSWESNYSSELSLCVHILWPPNILRWFVRLFCGGLAESPAKAKEVSQVPFMFINPVHI